MRRLILQMQMSVDGYFASTTGAAWQVWGWGDRWPWDAPLRSYFNSVFQSIDTILLSREMVEEGYLSHWGKTAAEHPADADYAFARRIGEVEKVVPTNKLQTSRWDRTTIAGGPLADAVTGLKSRTGKDIIAFGGISFASALFEKNLVDELQLFVNPFILGAGRSIFDGKPARPLKLVQSTGYECGIVVNRYRSAAFKPRGAD